MWTEGYSLHQVHPHSTEADGTVIFDMDRSDGWVVCRRWLDEHGRRCTTYLTPKPIPKDEAEAVLQEHNS